MNIHRNFERKYLHTKFYNLSFIVIIILCLASAFILGYYKYQVEYRHNKFSVPYFPDILFYIIVLITIVYIFNFYWRYQNAKIFRANKKEKSEEFLRFFISSMDMLCIADKNGTFLQLNPEWEKSLGYTLQELEGKKFIDFVHPDDIQQTIDASQLANLGKISNFLNRYKHKNGSYRWIEWRSYPAGNFIYASARDITEKKLTEENLLRNESRLLKAQQLGNLGYSEHYVQEQKIWATAEGKRIYGLPAVEGFVSLSIVANILEDVVPFQQAIKELFDKDKKFEIEYWIRPADGSERRFIRAVVELERDSNAKPWKILSMFQDITEQKLALEKTIQNETKYRLLFENMTNGFALHDMLYDDEGVPIDYRYIEVNPAFEKLTGATAKALIGNTVKEVMPETEDYWIKTFGNVAKTGEPVFYINYAKELGRYYDTFVFCPAPNQFAVVFNDVTERVTAENSLKISESRFRSIIENFPLGIGICDMAGNINFINNSFFNLFGYELSEIPTIDQWAVRAYPGSEYREKTITQWNQDIFDLIESKAPISPKRVYNIASKNGIVLNIEIEFIILGEEIFVLFSDVSEKLQALNELAQNERRLSCIIDILQYKAKNIQDFLDFTLSEAIKLTESKFGYIYHYSEDRKEFVLNSWSRDVMTDCNIVNPQTCYELDKTGIWGEAVRQRKSIILNDFNATHPLKKGLPHGHAPLFRFLTSPIFRDKKIIAVIGLANKLTNYSNNDLAQVGLLMDAAMKVVDNIRNEESIIELNATLERKVEDRTMQLAQANKELESFAYSVSHDLRAPIRHIDGFSKLLFSNIKEPNEAIINYFGKISQASKNMSVMIDELLSFSRLGRKELILADINLNILIQDLKEQIKPDIINREIEWIIHPLPTIPADRNLLKFALNNIISNAVKYTNKITKTVIEIGFNDIPDNKVEIYIKDNGIGFDMTYSEKLFGVFQRLHSNEEFEGVGIGLANVKQIINKHNGSIRAEGIPNVGATFYITLSK